MASTNWLKTMRDSVRRQPRKKRFTLSRTVRLRGKGWTRLILRFLSHSCNCGRVAGKACLPLVLLVLAVFVSGSGQSQNAAPSNAAPSFAKLSAKAEAARKANRMEEAESLYEEALTLNSAWTEGWWSLGKIAYERQSYRQAVTAFQKATALAPKSGNAYAMLGLSEFELGRDLSALQHLEQGARLGLNGNAGLRDVALQHEGRLQQGLGRFQAARATLEGLCSQGVTNDELASTLGLVLLRMQGKNFPAPGSTGAEIVADVGRGGCLSGQKKFDEGGQVLSAVVRQHPKFPNIHTAFGMLLLEASDLAAAVGEFKEEIKNNPTDVASREQLASVLYMTDSAAGVSYAEEAVKLAPQEPYGHYLLGLLLLDVDDYRKAIPELEIARKAFPSETRIYLALGGAYSRAGRKQDAEEARAAFLRLTEEGKQPATEGAPGPLTVGPEKILADEPPATRQ